MDIDLLAKMVGDLILEHDEVALPGVGTFVAEMVGASFSDKGFVINPPYRKLSFRQREGDPDLLIDFYARTNSLDKATASRILSQFLSEMKEILKTKKYIIFPGLGRLRATRENLFFFVPDEDLNIYPEGFGLEPVSLKSHEEVGEIAELTETVDVLADIKGTETPESVPSAPEIPSDRTKTPETVPSAPEIPSDSTETSESVLSEPVEVPAPVDKTAVAPSSVAPAPADKTAVAPSAVAPVAPSAAAPVTPIKENSAPAAKTPSSPEHHHHHHHHHHSSRRHRKMPVWQKELLILGCAAIVLLVLLAVLGRVAPEFVDRFLYSRDELEILYR